MHLQQYLTNNVTKLAKQPKTVLYRYRTSGWQENSVSCFGVSAIFLAILRYILNLVENEIFLSTQHGINGFYVESNFFQKNTQASMGLVIIFGAKIKLIWRKKMTSLQQHLVGIWLAFMVWLTLFIYYLLITLLCRGCSNLLTNTQKIRRLHASNKEERPLHENFEVKYLLDLPCCIKSD